jgi:ribosomal protein S18 acetylase RimI-like enzyme
MIYLRPMLEKEYIPYLERSIIEYAEDKIKAGNWHPSEALERSRQEFQKLLPEGPETPCQHLYSILADDLVEPVGIIWFAEILDTAKPYAFIYDFSIDEDYRRKGYGSQAMLALEDEVRQVGLEQIGLHVFGHNAAALALYQKLDYRITNINMMKTLSEAGTNDQE